MSKTTIFAVLALAASCASAADVSGVKVRVLDGFGGDSGSVLARCQTKPGTTYDPAVVSRDVVSLRDSGAYQDISADVALGDGGVEVTFSVFRKMRWQGPLAVEGNKAFGLAKITSEAGLRDGRLYGEADFADAADKVRKYYRSKGYPRASVTPVAKAVPGGGDVCTLTLLVDEGPELEIADWVFKGASDDKSWFASLDWFGEPDEDAGMRSDDLRKLIGVYPWWNYNCLFTDEPGTAQELSDAAKKVAAHFADLGYLDASVPDPVLERDDKGRGVYVFTVDRGRRYTVGDVSVTGLEKYSAEEVVAKSDLPKKGDVAGAKALDEAAHRIEVTLGSGDLGLAESHVTCRTIPRGDDPSVVDLVFAAKEGHPVKVNQIRVRGNDFTRDKVVRREIQLDPGVRMLSDKAETSKRKLEGLEYFSRVKYYLRDAAMPPEPDGTEYRDLVFEVEDRDTGNFMIGVGASSIDSVFFYADLQQSNFDLFAPDKMFRGAGQKGRLAVQAGPRIQTYEASVTEPWLFDRQLELTVEAYRRQRWYDEYDIIRSGAAASISYPTKFFNPARLWRPDAAQLVEFGRFGVRLSAEFIQFDDIERGSWWYHGREVSLREEDRKYGDAFEGVAHIFWSRDTTDLLRRPTKGSRSSVYLDLAGGDNEYWRLGFRHRTYLTTWKRYRHVLALAVRAETIDSFSGGVPIYNRLFLGGPRSVRGVEYRHVSPFARRYKDDDLGNSYTPWGGQTFFCANAEYTIPIVQMLRVAAFSDLGSVGADEFDLDFSDTFAWSVGLGLRLDIPSFPIRLDFATPIKKPDHADKEVFSFTMGYDF